MSTDFIRLSKLMSKKGLCSRREADALITKGWVSVDGEIINQLGTKVSPKAKVKILHEGQKQLNQKITILLNKPIGYVSSQPEDGYTPAASLIKPENQSELDKSGHLKKQHVEGLAPAGRLDIDSTGLIIFTQDGVLAKKVIHADSDIEKEYIVRVKGEVNERLIKKLSCGLSLDGKKLKPTKIKLTGQQRLCFILKEGRKRQIRRMCELVGLKILFLKRVRIGKVHLGALKEGEWRFLNANEKI